MASARARRPDPTRSTANERLKKGFEAALWTGIVLATIGHFAVLTLWPEMTATFVVRPEVEAPTVLRLPPLTIPPPPTELQRPVTPVMSADAPDDVTIHVTTWAENPVPPQAPPPAPVATTVSTEPDFNPFTVGPRILNRDEVVRAMERAYPPLLRDTGIGGTVDVFFRIDAEGIVRDARIDQSSGHEALDEAALSVARVYRFSPALNRDQKVAVWVSIPVTFRVR